MDNFSDRLQTLLFDKKITQTKLAKEAGINNVTISRWKSGEFVPKEDNLIKIANATGCNLTWLRDGTGPMFSQPGDQININLTRRIGSQPDTPDDPEYSHIRLYDVEAVAGHEAPHTENETVLDVLAFRTAWIRTELRVDPMQLSMIFVTGDSMEPTLTAGDMILIDHAAIDSVTDGIWVITMGDGPIVKRVERLSRNELRIISDNEKYKPRTINLETPPDGMKFIGRVVWSGKRM